MLQKQAKLPQIMVAPTGARRSKADHPNLPMTLPEILDEAAACRAAGADALHLHIRDDQGRHSLDAGRYREALDALEDLLPEFPVQITTESGGVFDVASQYACLRDVRPRAASISVREIARDLELAPRLYRLCHDNGTQVQHILYDINDWHQLKDWQAKSVTMPDQTNMILVLGRYSPARDATVDDLANWTDIIAASAGSCMVCAFGQAERDVLCAAAAMGADLRIGFENNILSPSGALAPSNSANVAALKAALVSHLSEA